MLQIQQYAIGDDFAESAKIFALLRTAAGEDLTATDVGGKQALDVNVANEISIELNGIYDVSTNPNPDHTGLILNDRAAAPNETGQTRRTTGATLDSDALVAANIHALDVAGFGHLYNGTTWDRATGTSGAADVHLKSQEAGFAVNVKQCLTGPVFSNNNVVDTAELVVATPLSGRCKILIRNIGNKSAYLGSANTVTTSGANKGLPLKPGEAFEEWLDAAATLWVISESAGTDLSVVEYQAA